MKLFKQSTDERFMEETTMLDLIRDQLENIKKKAIEYDRDEEWIGVEIENTKGDTMFTITIIFDEDKLDSIQIHSAPIKKVTVFEDQKRLL